MAKKRERRRHEARFAVALKMFWPNTSAARELAVPRYARVLDFVQVFSAAPGGFGPWDDVLANRIGYFEHYSGWPTVEQLDDVRVGLHWLRKQWRIDARERRRWNAQNGTEPPFVSSLSDSAAFATRPPIAIVLAGRISAKTIAKFGEMDVARMPDESGELVGEPIPGAWITRDIENGGILALDMSALPREGGFSLLRWIQTPDTQVVATERLNDLLGDPEIPIVLRDAAYEAIMNQSIGTDFEHETVIERTLRIGREEGELITQRAAVLAVLSARGIEVGPESVSRIRACEDVSLLSRWLIRAVSANTISDVFSA